MLVKISSKSNEDDSYVLQKFLNENIVSSDELISKFQNDILSGKLKCNPYNINKQHDFNNKEVLLHHINMIYNEQIALLKLVNSGRLLPISNRLNEESFNIFVKDDSHVSQQYFITFNFLYFFNNFVIVK